MDAGDFIFLNHKILSKQEKISLITLDNIHKIPFLRKAYELAKNENKRLVHLCTGDVPPVKPVRNPSPSVSTIRRPSLPATRSTAVVPWTFLSAVPPYVIAALLTEASATDNVRRANFTNFIWIIYLN